MFVLGAVVATAALGAAAAAAVVARQRRTATAATPTSATLLAGRYRLVRELGHGAAGTVHLAEDMRQGTEIAVKTIGLTEAPDAADRVDARRRLLREADAAGRLRHPDIVHVTDVGEHGRIAFIAMELAHGTDLRAHTDVGALLPVDTVLQIAARVALALDHAHRLGIVHRDVKPANVMWHAATGAVKVTDFGIASVADAERTRTGVLLGTPVYMSPEQLAGGRVDGRSDLFSLGVMLYELLTGSLPYRDGSTAELLRQIAAAPPPDLRERRPELPGALADVVVIALQKPPALRYPDGRALAHDLLAIARRSNDGTAHDAA